MDKKHYFKKNLLYSIISAVITILASVLAYIIDVPNPVIVLVIFMIVFTALMGSVQGAVSGVCIILYAMFFFSEEHDFISYTHENAYKCMVIIISMVIIYIIVALLKRKHDTAYESLMKQNQRLEEESDLDALTGIYNRRGGDRRVEECLDANDDIQAVYAAMDIDDFKRINDVYGHAAGDTAIQELVARLKEAFPENSVLIRNGGDEFQAFIYGDDPAEIEKQIVSFTDETFYVDLSYHRFHFHISCGYAFYPGQARTMDDLYHKADIALYDVKMSGKHKALPYTWTADTSRPEKLTLTVTGLSNYLPVAFMVYRADESEEILIASASLLRVCECSNFSEFTSYTGGSFRGFVYPDDLERVEQSITDQVSKNVRELDEVDYRIRTKSGKIVRIHDLGRRIHDPGLGDLFYVALNDIDATSV